MDFEKDCCKSGCTQWVADAACPEHGIVVLLKREQEHLESDEVITYFEEALGARDEEYGGTNP